MKSANVMSIEEYKRQKMLREINRWYARMFPALPIEITELIKKDNKSDKITIIEDKPRKK